MIELNLAFYTCFYGSDDNPAFVIPEVPSLKHACFYYTNNKTIFETLKNTDWIGVWDCVQATEDLIESQMASIPIRAKPSEYNELRYYDYTCFLDSKLQKMNVVFVEDLIREYFIEKDYVMLLRTHPWITGNVWEEAFASMDQPRYRSQWQMIYRYIHNQLTKGFSPITEKHCATGLLIKNMKHERALELETIWWEHAKACGTQGQISFFFVKQLFEGLIHPFPENPFDFNYKQKMNK
jgi:hypothetical protein